MPAELRGTVRRGQEAEAHLKARKFRLHPSSLAMECAQPSVSLLLNRLERSGREETWRQGTVHGDHPSAQDSSCPVACGLRPRQYPAQPVTRPQLPPGVGPRATHANFCSFSQ